MPTDQPASGKRLSRKAFDAWLSKQPARKARDMADIDHCWIATFLGGGWFVDTRFMHNLDRYPASIAIPKWATEFQIRLIGDRAEAKVTAARALKTLRAIP